MMVMRGLGTLLGVVSTATFLPMVAKAQSAIPLFDRNWQLVPEACQSCPCGMGGILQLIQSVMNVAISFGLVIFVLVIVVAGFSLLLTPTNPGGRMKARMIITNAMVGFVITISAWLIVDFVMKLIYDGDTTFGPWNSILTGGDICIQPGENKSLFDGDIFSTPGGTTVGGFDYSAGPSIGACNPSNLLAAAQAGGFNLSQSDAQVFACIARPESSCGTRNRNYRWGRGSSAYGAFQVLLQQNSRHYENAACRRAAGLAEGEQLNCHLGFQNGNPIPGSPVVQRCINAASNLTCSLAAAVSLKNAAGNFSPWHADRNSARQRACSQ